jgi:benzoyl-CoA reductase subunit B
LTLNERDYIMVLKLDWSLGWRTKAMSANATYETRRLECMDKAKELQGAYFGGIGQAKDDGKLVAVGGYPLLSILYAGLGDIHINSGTGDVVAMATNPDLAERSFKAMESKGYSRDLCPMTLLGSAAYMGDIAAFGTLPKPHVWLNLVCCDLALGLTGVQREHWGIPVFNLDYPITSAENKDSHLEYFASQMLDAIEWMEQVTGRTYDDELFIEAVRNDSRITTLWARICEANKAVPAPLSQQMLMMLSFPAACMRHKTSTADLYQMTWEEIQERVRDGIAAVASERCRLIHEGLPPLFFMQLLRFPEKYGAVFIGSHYDFSLNGAFERIDDGSWQVIPSLDEQGVELRSREDAVKALARRNLRSPQWQAYLVEPHAMDIAKIVEDWRADGAVLHMDRGCKSLSGARVAAKRMIQERGFPAVLYEGDAANSQRFNQDEVLDRLESFLESMGLSRLKD